MRFAMPVEKYVVTLHSDLSDGPKHIGLFLDALSESDCQFTSIHSLSPVRIRGHRRSRLKSDHRSITRILSSLDARYPWAAQMGRMMGDERSFTGD